MEALVLVLAFIAGLGVRSLGYPPLLGYLAAGFVAAGLGLGSAESLAPLADAGILLLLFTIGLKLNFDELKPRYVWGAALLHMVVVIPLTAVMIGLVAELYPPLAFDSPLAVWVLAFALSFSSTVLAVKIFEERGEAQSFYAKIAIGVLVVQDVLAVGYTLVASGYWPSPWALLVLAMPLLLKPLGHAMRWIGRGELQLLCGVVMALGAAELFELVGLKGGLGALCMGMLAGYANKPKARELYKQLLSLKNLLLIGFFLQIGYYGFPSLPMLLIALLLAVLIMIRPAVYFALFSRFGLRARTSWLTGLALFHYSEFGLIVTALAVEGGLLQSEWVTTLAVALSASFFLSTPINNKAHDLFQLLEHRLLRFEKPERLTEEQVGSLGDAEVVVLGMGRIGRNVYNALREQGEAHVAGVEEKYTAAKALTADGFNCLHGDAADRDFWERTRLTDRRLVLVSLSNHRENLAVAKLARSLDYKGTLAVAARYVDEQEELEALGCVAFNLYQDVGRDFAEYTLEQMQRPATKV